MSAQQPRPQPPLDFDVSGLDLNELLRRVNEFIVSNGVGITCESGSNPHFHFHISGNIMSKKDETNTQYTTTNSGSIGAVAQGTQSSATNHGGVVQNQSLGQSQAAALVTAFAQLSELLSDLNLGDTRNLQETINSIDEAKREASVAESQKSRIATLWEQAKHWIDSALSVGIFATDKAAIVRTLITRITELLT
ncbi:hypothetical protein [Tuwongella immobilis]|uniref:Uncharacterized protein n=1 Tax=Tuwongella immobilis TaxID=692036 RepID=A0A6C2YQR6_9BACT|nr:hypothetical protein [Tuwongella immobilis]VIP03990.1 unnamed protein product [Tuwongella immobilis]VTS05347.1 unnamed protein product [Tuwongella immobilis]